MKWLSLFIIAHSSRHNLSAHSFQQPAPFLVRRSSSLTIDLGTKPIRKVGLAALPSTWSIVDSCQFDNTLVNLDIQINDAVLSNQVGSQLLLASAGDVTWRQYVALAVILGVIVDILLGSPVAGAIAAPLRKQVEEMQSETINSGRASRESRERVDTEAIANAALEKVYGAMELKDYLERNKTDRDRMEEMRRKIDMQLSELEK